MGRITPNNRRETAEAWACVPPALLLSGIELGRDMSRDMGTKAAITISKGIEAIRRRQTESETGAAALSLSIQAQEQPLEPQLATVTQLHPGIVALPPSELPLEAA
jgi:hypothetical protein